MTAAVPPAPTSTPVPSTNTPVAPHANKIVASTWLRYSTVGSPPLVQLR
jgi:hypothetical protein